MILHILFNSYSLRADTQYGVSERQHRDSMENGDGTGEVCFQKLIFIRF